VARLNEGDVVTARRQQWLRLHPRKGDDPGVVWRQRAYPSGLLRRQSGR
jgi:hypothetical protein